VTNQVADGAAPATGPTAGAGATSKGRPARKRRYSPLNRRDKLILFLMVAVPTAVVTILVIIPTILSIIWSFGTWNGIGDPLTRTNWVGLWNYEVLFTKYPFFWPAVQHNIIWLVWLALLATPLGMFLAVLLDKNIRGTRFYQGALYMPVVLSLAIIGFIWGNLIYSPDQGLLNNLLGTTSRDDTFIDWLGNRDLNLWSVLVAASWRHVGYVMILYLAGLKAFDPSLREAAQIDGANERQTFFHVVFPVMKPINIVVVVITVIESLRAFDIVYVINKGLNGLELLSILVTNNIVGEGVRVGFGSAIAVVLLLLSLIPITAFLLRMLRDDSL
jgi:multiple sugar transport system permease protein